LRRLQRNSRTSNLNTLASTSCDDVNCGRVHSHHATDSGDAVLTNIDQFRICLVSTLASTKKSCKMIGARRQPSPSIKAGLPRARRTRIDQKGSTGDCKIAH